MLISAALTEFQKHCQQYYICYVLAASGLSDHATKIASFSPERDRTFLVGHGHPDDGNFQGAIKVGQMLEHSERGGAFADMIAKSFVVAIYSLWDELYRPLLANETSVSKKLIQAELMGDIRLVRHCIVHAKSVVTNEGSKLKQLAWTLHPGSLSISGEMFQVFIDQVNKMQVRVGTSPTL